MISPGCFSPPVGSQLNLNPLEDPQWALDRSDGRALKSDLFQEEHRRKRCPAGNPNSLLLGQYRLHVDQR